MISLYHVYVVKINKMTLCTEIASRATNIKGFALPGGFDIILYQFPWFYPKVKTWNFIKLQIKKTKFMPFKTSFDSCL